MIYFNCSNCQEPLEAPESLRGDRLQCPNCNSQELVPGGNTSLQQAKKRRLIRRVIAAAILVVLITGGVIIWNVFHPPIYEMTKPQLTSFLLSKGFHTDNDDYWWQHHNVSFFFPNEETETTAFVTVSWRYLGGDIQDEDSYGILGMTINAGGSTTDTLDNSMPALVVWNSLEPDLVPLFVRFREARVGSFDNVQHRPLRYKETDYVYSWSQPNMFSLDYLPNVTN